MSIGKVTTLWALLTFFSPVHSIVKLGLPFSDHMVLQRNLTVPIWGIADRNEFITVTFRDQVKSTTADSNGHWRVNLDPTSEGGPFELSVQGENTLALSDIMVGEVWICGGQSNMLLTMENIGGPNLDSVKAADLPNIRFINVKDSKIWNRCSPSMALNLSATSYYFGLELQRTLNVPIGLIISAAGGTTVEQWMDSVSLFKDPVLRKDTSSQNGSLFKLYIQPLIPFAIKGFVWYQGESNAQNPFPTHPYWTVNYYREHFKDLIFGWRTLWNQGELPFCYAQIANYSTAQVDPGEYSPWAELREAQRLSLTIPNTYMAVLIDIGDSVNIHPVNKWEVGKRLSLPVLSNTYGALPLEWSGPIYQSVESRGNTLRIVFTHAQGLTAKNSATDINGATPHGFAISGIDKRWAWADATIEGDTVVVNSSTIRNPIMVRYGWGSNPNCNLYNSSGLPASPFQINLTQEVIGYNLNTNPPNPNKKGSGPILKWKHYSHNALGRRLEVTKRANSGANELKIH